MVSPKTLTPKVDRNPPKWSHLRLELELQILRQQLDDAYEEVSINLDKAVNLVKSMEKFPLVHRSIKLPSRGAYRRSRISCQSHRIVEDPSFGVKKIVQGG